MNETVTLVDMTYQSFVKVATEISMMENISLDDAIEKLDSMENMRVVLKS